MVSALDSGWSGLGSSPGRGYCLMFLGKTLYSHSASLHPGVQMGTGKYAGCNPAMEKHPIRGEYQYSQPLHAKGNRSQAPAPRATWNCIKALILLFFISSTQTPSTGGVTENLTNSSADRITIEVISKRCIKHYEIHRKKKTEKQNKNKTKTKTTKIKTRQKQKLKKKQSFLKKFTTS